MPYVLLNIFKVITVRAVKWVAATVIGPDWLISKSCPGIALANKYVLDITIVVVGSVRCQS